MFIVFVFILSPDSLGGVFEIGETLHIGRAVIIQDYLRVANHLIVES